jgi:hypothetical protein
MNFFATCVDNFFDDPNKIRDIALSLDFVEDGTYPGYRTKELAKIDQNLYHLISKKILSIFYNIEEDIVDYEIDMSFQKIYPYDDNLIDEINSGWYHVDDDSIASGVIYLNPESYPFAGTTIAAPHQHYDDSKCDFQYLLKNIFYNNLYKDPNFDRNEYRQIKLRHGLNFQKSIEFKNHYNRLVLYDGQYYHRESSFYANDHEPRLTLVFFISNLKVNNLPVQRKNKIKL